jgi:hypothetical protein
MCSSKWKMKNSKFAVRSRVSVTYSYCASTCLLLTYHNRIKVNSKYHSEPAPEDKSNSSSCCLHLLCNTTMSQLSSRKWKIEIENNDPVYFPYWWLYNGFSYLMINNIVHMSCDSSPYFLFATIKSWSLPPLVPAVGQTTRCNELTVNVPWYCLQACHATPKNDILV